MARSNKTLIDLTTKLKSLLETLADTATWASLIAIAGVLIYIGTGIFSGQVFRVEPGQVQRVAGGMDMMTRILMYCCWVASFCSMLRAKENQADIGGAIVAGGLFFWLGFPVLVEYLRSSKGGQANQAVDLMVRNVVVTGQIMLIAMAWPVLVVVWRYIKTVPLRRKQDEEVERAKLRRETPKDTRFKANFLSPCWHLPYCRDYLVAMCPAFKARRRCWKFGGGCFCDQNLIESMLTGLSRGPKRGEQAYMRSEIAARTGIMHQRKKRPPCKKCFIYLEHEKLKYEAMHPLMYPLTAAIIYFGYEPVVQKFWLWSQAELTNLWSRLSYQAVTETPQSIGQIAGMEAVTVMFAILLGMSLLLGLLRLCELWCFQWKI